MLINSEWMMIRDSIENPFSKKEKFPQSLIMRFNMNILLIFLELGSLSSFSHG